MKIACCFCDAEFPAWESLGKHLCETACGQRRVNGRKIIEWTIPREGGRKSYGLVCWCGARFSFVRKLSKHRSPWAAHMRDVGGLANHILELTMGEQHG